MPQLLSAALVACIVGARAGTSEGSQRIDPDTLRHWILIKNFNVNSTVTVRVTA